VHSAARVCSAPAIHPKCGGAIACSDINVARRLLTFGCAWSPRFVSAVMDAGLLRALVAPVTGLSAVATDERVARFVRGKSGGGMRTWDFAADSTPGAGAPVDGGGDDGDNVESAIADHRFRLALLCADALHACVCAGSAAAGFLSQVPAVVDAVASPQLLALRPTAALLWSLLFVGLQAATPASGAAKVRPSRRCVRSLRCRGPRALFVVCARY
jgi:hypothetical protein